MHKTFTIKINMQRQATYMPYLIKDKQITRYRVRKNASWRATPSLSIAHSHIGAFTTSKPDRIHLVRQYFHSVWLQIYVMSRSHCTTGHMFVRSTLPQQNTVNKVECIVKARTLPRRLKLITASYLLQAPLRIRIFAIFLCESSIFIM